jgi:hypothetical protein
MTIADTIAIITAEAGAEANTTMRTPTAEVAHELRDGRVAGITTTIIPMIVLTMIAIMMIAPAATTIDTMTVTIEDMGADMGALGDIAHRTM